MANRFDIIYRGGDVTTHNYNHEGEKWKFWSFERRGERAADAAVTALEAKGYEAKRVMVGTERRHDCDN